MFLSRFSILWPSPEGLDPAVVAQVRTHPDVEAVTPAMLIQIGLPHVLGGESDRFYLLGLREGDMPTILARCSATLKEGDLLAPRGSGILLSADVAMNLGLEVGDTLHSRMDPELYGNIVDPMQVVGILDSDLRLGVVSLEYLENHETYQIWPQHALVLAQEGSEQVVDDYLAGEIRAAGSGVQTLELLAKRMDAEYRSSLSLLLPIIVLVATGITLVVGAVNRIALSRRLPEFGTLNAAGYSRHRLTRRLTGETTAMAVAGWLGGVGLAWLTLALLKLMLFDPRGHDLTVVSLTPAVPVLLVPVAVIGFILKMARRTFARMDAVSVLERGELTEDEDRRRARGQGESVIRPLSALTFYRRHKSRTALLVGVMALMMVATVLIIFLLAAADDAQRGSLAYLSEVSRVRPLPASAEGAAVMGQVRNHPAVDRVILIPPRWHMLGVFIPPFGDSANASPFGVYADDMAYLVELFDLELEQGHLPRPHTNEMVIPQIVAQNRRLKVGDVVGDRNNPAYSGAPILPAEFVISGVFAPAATGQGENWLGFVSLEYMESHEGFMLGEGARYAYLVVPKTGQKVVLDSWLENELAGETAEVMTHSKQTALVREKTQSLILTIALLESVIAVVAALALAVLNTISISQRLSEFGVLHAMGYGRLPLIWRTVRETLLTSGLAWGFSVLLLLAGLAALQVSLFEPLGLALNPLNLLPWASTVPIPVAALVATAGTTARTLITLDPVSIIERK